MSDSLRERIYALCADHAAGRVDAVVDAFADDIDYVCYAPVDVFPYLGRRRGKAEVAASLKAAHAEFEYLSYQPIFVVAEKDDGAAIVLVRLKQRSTGRIIHLFVAHFVRFRDGRIAELREFMDSFDVVQQVLGREFDLTKP
jgi:ketosteroid isomerase-like protein